MSPLMLYFHGWGGAYDSCGKECSTQAVNKGIVTVAMSGYGPSGWNSWKHGGSSDTDRSPNPSGSSVCKWWAQGSCEVYSNSGCGDKCNQEDSQCWWTTCYDSVEQVMAILDEVEQSLCIDLDQIWAVGCSNGSMFTFELARDSRSAPRLKGIVPVVGLPHYGYSEGPLFDNIKMMGMWGRDDDVVPPISNTNNPDKTLDEGSGWFYTSSNKVMSDWTVKKGCTGNGQDPIGQKDWGISNYKNRLSCTQSCAEKNDHIVGCIAEAGHWCFSKFMWEPIFNYMLDDGSQDNCVNNKNFRYKNKEKKTCKWISKTETRRQNLCQNELVVKNCPGVCGVCCANDAWFQFKLYNGKKKKCEWLNKTNRIEYYCPRGQIETQCPVNCGVCQNSNDPSNIFGNRL